MEKAQQEVPQKPRHEPYHIGGVRVLLPVKPYPSQLAMMAQIMKGLKHRQNCLLESPTGSGKSLALLCSTLAWQREEMDKVRRYNDLLESGVTDPDVLARAAGLPVLPPRPMRGASQGQSTTVPPSSTPAPNTQAVDSGSGFFYEEDDDFRSQPSLVRQPEMRDVTHMEDEVDYLNQEENVAQRPQKLRFPKIFLGTRTHKQVEQIVKELRRTAYSDVNMVVLSSREHTCIHPYVSVSSNKAEKCRELNNPDMGSLCSFYHGANRINTHDHLAQCGGLQGAWDIEDLLRVGHKLKACPYYTARGLLQSADLVICPYNYLVDPIVRESMNITLNNHVVVLDEAHNIEDSARDAASCTVTQEELDDASKHLREQEMFPKECQKLADLLSALSSWIDENNLNLTDYSDYGRSGKIYTGTEIIAILDHMGVTMQSYGELQALFKLLTDEQISEENQTLLSPVAKKVLRDLFLVFCYLFTDNMKYKDDYRVALVKEQVRKKSAKGIDGWTRRSVLVLEYSLNFWCLNPAVAFSPISEVTHNIILTSGTLSPMNSFQSELGVDFKIHLEANHVIDPNQIFVGTIGHGPRGKPLQATYQKTETWEFQDELGEVVLNVCQTVPGGILCFLPSYSMLNKLHDRWQSTGVWDEISKVKEAMTEQRKGEDFERDMSHFYATIRNAQMEGASAISGVFFMAVYRGKVSEGLDFTDDNARAVIAVGIPFPNVKNIQVDLKKRYNNTFQKSRKLLSGQEWYEIQAYRALNQALGRCIRHRYDWGALLLVDLRFQSQRENYYTRGLSKWVRNKVTHPRNFSVATNTLREFVNNMMANPPQPPKRQGEELLATLLESTSEEKIKSSPTVDSDTCCPKVVDSPQTASAKGNTISKFLKKSSQTNSTCDRLKENISHDQKECSTSQSRSSGNQKKYGAASCASSKENNGMLSQSKKRTYTAVDYQDMEDFNLALSPSTPQANHPPPPLRKRPGEKKGIIYIDEN